MFNFLLHFEQKKLQQTHYNVREKLRKFQYLLQDLTIIFLSLFLYVSLSICLSVYLSVYLPIYLCVYLSLCINLTAFQSLCLSISLPFNLSIYQSLYLFLSFYIVSLTQHTRTNTHSNTPMHRLLIVRKQRERQKVCDSVLHCTGLPLFHRHLK